MTFVEAVPMQLAVRNLGVSWASGALSILRRDIKPTNLVPLEPQRPLPVRLEARHPSLDRGEALRLDIRDGRVDLRVRDDEVRAVVAVADRDGLLRGADRRRAVRGDRRLAPRVALAVREEEVVRRRVPAAVRDVGRRDVRRLGARDRLREEVRALALREGGVSDRHE